MDTNVTSDTIEGIFWEDKPDHRILALAHNLARQHGRDRVILVSKDINLRMKAKSIGVQAEDYETGKVKDIGELYTGRIARGRGRPIIDELYGRVRPTGRSAGPPPVPNEYFIIRNCTKSALPLRRPASYWPSKRRRPTASSRATPSRPFPSTRSPTMNPARDAGGQGRHRQDPDGPGRGARAATYKQISWRGPSSRFPTGTSATCPATSRASSIPTCSRSSTTCR